MHRFHPSGGEENTHTLTYLPQMYRYNNKEAEMQQPGCKAGVRVGYYALSLRVDYEVLGTRMHAEGAACCRGFYWCWMLPASWCCTRQHQHQQQAKMIHFNANLDSATEIAPPCNRKSESEGNKTWGTRGSLSAEQEGGGGCTWSGKCTLSE